MIPVTQEFMERMTAPTRYIKGRVVIDYTDWMIDQSLRIETTSGAYNSRPQQTADGFEEVAYKWISLDGSWKLDGTWHPAPAPKDPSHYQLGWWGGELSGADRTFTTLQKLTIYHHPRPIHSLKVVGDSAREEWPEDFDILLYDLDDNLVHTQVVTGNEEIFWALQFESPVLDVVRQELVVKRWSHPQRQVKIVEFFTSVQQTYTGNQLMEIRLLEERDVTQETLPIGVISSNEIFIRLRNDHRHFDLDNANSPIYRLLKPSRRIRAWLGIAEEVEGENIEIITETEQDWNQGTLVGVNASEEGLQIQF